MDAQRAAEIAEDMSGRGYGAWDIADELRTAADAAEFGWIGVKYAGVTAGVVPETEGDYAIRTLDDVYELLSDKKTLQMKALREALGEGG